MFDREEKQFSEIKNKLDSSKALINEDFKSSLKSRVVAEFNKTPFSFSIPEWSLNFLSLVLVLISVTLVAYFGVLYNSGNRTNVGTGVLLSESERTTILENYSRNNIETKVVSLPTEDSQTYFIVNKTQTFGSAYFRCANSYTVVSQNIKQYISTSNNEVLVREEIRDGIGNLISDSIVVYGPETNILEEYRGGSYIAVDSNLQQISELETAPVVRSSNKNGKEVFEIEMRSFIDCNNQKEQLITIKTIDAESFKIELESIYVGDESEFNLYSLTTVKTEELAISESEYKEIFEFSSSSLPKTTKEINDTSFIDYLVPSARNSRSSYVATNIVSETNKPVYFDRNFYPSNRWGRSLLEHNVNVSNNPAISYDIQISPFEFAKVRVSVLENVSEGNYEDRSININGKKVEAKILSVPVSFAEGNKFLAFRHNGYNYQIETTNLELFDNLITQSE